MTQRQFPVKLVAAGVLGIGGVAAAVVTLLSQMPPPRLIASGGHLESPGASSTAVSFDIVTDDVGVPAAAERAAAALTAAEAEAIPPHLWTPATKAAYSREVQEALSIYLAADLAGYDAALQDRGVPQAKQWPSEEAKRRIWEMSSAILKSANLSSADVVVRPRYIEGQLVEYEDETNFVRGKRYTKTPLLADPARNKVTVFEVVYRAELTTHEGVDFVGRLGLSFAYEPAQERWHLVEIVVYDVPSGVLVVMPML